MDFLSSTSIQTEALVSRFRAHRKETEARVTQSDVGVDAHAAAPSRGDKVEISLTANMTVETVNGILNDSVVEQINKAIQEAGIDLRVEAETGTDQSPEATARRIVDFATGFLETYQANHAAEASKAQVGGFMTLIRDAIQEGFTHARDFLESITKLSDTINANIDKTFELTSGFLDAFHQTQLKALEGASGGSDEVDAEAGETTVEEV